MTFEEWAAKTIPMTGAEYELARCAWEAATLAEREACSNVCENISGNEPSGHGGRYGALDCAAAIKMRSSV